jgi:DNA-binding transcriptional regulator YdaS (Cro superfamily)
MKAYLKTLYGSQKACAEELGVTTATVQNWIKKNPRGILRHAPEIIRYKNTTFTQLMGEVMFREYELTELEPIRRGEV